MVLQSFLTVYHPWGLGRTVHLPDLILSICKTGPVLITGIYQGKAGDQTGLVPCGLPSSV